MAPSLSPVALFLGFQICCFGWIAQSLVLNECVKIKMSAFIFSLLSS